jgi:hypothetical protein
VHEQSLKASDILEIYRCRKEGFVTVMHVKQEQRSIGQDEGPNHFSAFLLISKMIPVPNMINFLRVDRQYFFHVGSEMRITPQSRITRITISDDKVCIRAMNDEKVELPVITPLFEKFIDNFLESGTIKPSFRSQLRSRSLFKKIEPRMTIIHLESYITTLDFTVTTSNIIECPIPETLPVYRMHEKEPEYMRYKGAMIPIMEYSSSAIMTSPGLLLGEIARKAAEDVTD